MGDHTGTVIKVGVRSTRIKLLQGEEMVISNRELLSKPIRNFKKLKKRRILFNLKVDNNTSVEKLERIPEYIKKVIDKTKMASLDRVHFSHLGPFGLEYEIVYFIATGNYEKYMDIQQQINYGVLETFKKEGIKLSYFTEQIILDN